MAGRSLEKMYNKQQIDIGETVLTVDGGWLAGYVRDF